VNCVVNPERVAVKGEAGAGTDEPLPETYVDYETSPREYALCTISTLLDIHTRISDLYSSPYDQIAQQLRLPGGHHRRKGQRAVVRAGRA
jgi:hypothetical protein